MRLLYFTDNNSDHNRRFLDKLAVSGHEVHYLSLAGQPEPSFWLPRGIHLAPSRKQFRRHTPPSELKSFLPDLKAALDRIKPDLVQAGAIQSCAYLAALAEFHPMLAMSWGSDILVDSKRDAEWANATKTALAGGDGLFCDCETVRRRAQEIVPIPDERIVLFPWGIQSGIFIPEGPKVQLPFREHDFVFLCTRSWEPIYGMKVLLQAFKKASEKDDRLRLVLLGRGSQEDEIFEFIEDNDCTDRIFVPGAISGGEMPAYFRSASAYISCAESDGSSISLLEAMATGLPVIVADNPSNREWVKEDVNGWLGEIGSAESFAEKMLAAAGQEVIARKAMGEMNENIVAERADWDANFPLLLRTYEKLATPSHASRR